MNRQHILSRLASLGRRVVYSNGIAYYDQLGNLPLIPRPESRSGVTVMRRGYLVPGTHRPSPLRESALRGLARRLRAAAGCDRAEPVIGMGFEPGLLDHVSMLKPDLRVFHIYDSYFKMIDDESLQPQVAEVLREFDLVTASSSEMFEDVMGFPPESTQVVSNGVDYALFSNDQPEICDTARQIDALEGFKLGFVGSIKPKLDFLLIHALARAFREVSFVFVGPVRRKLLDQDPEASEAFDAVCSLPNVHLFGAVKYTRLPGVMRALDSGCVFSDISRCNWVKTQAPLKINEYFASGLPVLCSVNPHVEREFGSLVTICETVEDWKSALDGMLTKSASDDAKTARRAAAKANDWNHKVSYYDRLLTELEGL